jgi:hypothetical protein
MTRLLVAIRYLMLYDMTASYTSTTVIIVSNALSALVERLVS